MVSSLSRSLSRIFPSPPLQGKRMGSCFPSNDLLGPANNLVNLVNRRHWTRPLRECPRSLWLLSAQLPPRRYYPSLWFLPRSIHCPLNLWPYLPHWRPNEEGHEQLLPSIPRLSSQEVPQRSRVCSPPNLLNSSNFTH